MRKVCRPAKPSVLVNNDQRWNQKWVDLKTRKPSASFSWYDFNGKSVRDWIAQDLSLMTCGHCAFCDRYTVEPDSIEHFRPKSDERFLHLAYEWTNLFYCCGGCQLAKGGGWDDDLINPDAEDYSFFRYFIFDYSTGQISPNPVATVADQRRARVTIDLYDLDSVRRRRFRLNALRDWQRSSGVSIDEVPYRDFLEDPPLSPCTI